MDTQSSKLKMKLKHQAQELKKKDEEIARLKRAMHALVAGPAVYSGDDYEDYDDYGNPETDEEEDQYSNESDDLKILDDSTGKAPDPLYDGELHRCISCGFEVIEGECAACGKLHAHSKTDQVSARFRSSGTGNEAIHPDRSLVPRGTTPLQEFNSEDEALPSEYHSVYVDSSYIPARAEEYEQLRRRGATRLMCETFRLSFTEKDGIFAWADDDLFQEFSSPKMKPGNTWKIHLGRRFELDEDDFDGTAFIEGLLEDAIYFPLREPLSTRDFEVWDTVQEAPGVWVTKMKAHRPSKEEDFNLIEGRCILDRASDDSGYFNCADVAIANEDQLLTNFKEYDGPHRADEYEIEEGEGEQMTEELMDFYPDFIHRDSAWAGMEETEDDGTKDPTGSILKTLDDEDQDEAMDGNTTEDSFDSDFDSEEDMTGDERERYYSKLDGAAGC